MQHDFLVGARLRDGKIKHYQVSNVEDAMAARSYVLSQVPAAATVLAVIEGGRSMEFVVEPRVA